MIEDLTKTLLAEIEQAYQAPPFRSKKRARKWCKLLFSGQFFISHSSSDSEWCKKHIVQNIEHVCRRDDYFFYSQASGKWKANEYRLAIEFGFRYARTIIMAISEHSIRSPWVQIEARWAMKQRHPLIICLIDGTSPNVLSSRLGRRRWYDFYRQPTATLNFSADPSGAGAELSRLVQLREFAHNHRSRVDLPADNLLELWQKVAR